MNRYYFRFCLSHWLETGIEFLGSLTVSVSPACDDLSSHNMQVPGIPNIFVVWQHPPRHSVQTFNALSSVSHTLQRLVKHASQLAKWWDRLWRA